MPYKDQLLPFRSLFVVAGVAIVLYNVYISTRFLSPSIYDENVDTPTKQKTKSYHYHQYRPSIRKKQMKSSSFNFVNHKNKTHHVSSSWKQNKKSIKKKKYYEVQSKDGIDRYHMALDGAWIENVTNMLDCPKYDDSLGIISDDEDAFTNIPTKETWNAFMHAYHVTVDPNHEYMTATEYDNSWKVPIEVKFKRPEGRGVYASKFIPAGTPVWASTTRNTATFPTSHHHREFLEYLIKDPKTRQFACGNRMWIEVIWHHDDNGYSICQTLDEAVLLNTVLDPEDEDWDEKINLETIEFSEDEHDPDRDDYDCYGNDHYIAKRDIQAGEQLLIDYTVDDEDEAEGWQRLGLTYHEWKSL